MENEFIECRECLYYEAVVEANNTTYHDVCRLLSLIVKEPGTCDYAVRRTDEGIRKLHEELEKQPKTVRLD